MLLLLRERARAYVFVRLRFITIESLQRNNMHTKNYTPCSIGVRAMPNDAHNADWYQCEHTHKPKDACPYEGFHDAVLENDVLHVTAKAILPKTDRVPQNARNAFVMPLNRKVYVCVYRVRSFVLVEVGELLLQHVEEVLSVGHLVRLAACKLLVSCQALVGSQTYLERPIRHCFFWAQSRPQPCGILMAGLGARCQLLLDRVHIGEVVLATVSVYSVVC